MRWIFALAVALALATPVAPQLVPGWTAVAGDSVLSAQQQPQGAGKVDVDVDVHRGGGAWWTSPTWIAIGAIALVLLVVIIALIARGGGTTVIRE